MPKGRGRGSDEKTTHQTRVHADLGEMIAWIARVENTTTAQLLDPMLRAQVLARYTRHEAIIEKLKAAEAALRKAEAEARQSIQDAEEKPKKKRPE